MTTASAVGAEDSTQSSRQARSPIAVVTDLSVTFRRGSASLHALRGVSLDIQPGEIVGLVGESGSGKSVLGNALLGLLPASATVSGTVRVAGHDMTAGKSADLRTVRRSDLGAVFQDPMRSLNPTMRIGRQVNEATGDEKESVRLLAEVGVPEPQMRMRSYPHELSGGLRQRVMISMAVAGTPGLIIADEPTTALDVTVQAQVLALLRKIADEMGCAILMVTHDLGVAAQISDRIAVLYAGRIAEIGPTHTVLTEPAHPYTRGLLGSRLTLTTPRGTELPALRGEVPGPAAPLPGCAFAPRCALADQECEHRPPDPISVGESHVSACILGADAVARGLPLTTAAVDHAGPQTVSAGDDETVRREPVVPAPAAVSLTDVTKSFVVKRGFARRGEARSLQALRRISVDVAPGESLAIVGESGSGKSTLLRVIAGLETATSGSVRVDGGRPQMVFQDAGASLTPWLNVGTIIGERLAGSRLSHSERKDAVVEALRRVGLPADVMKARVSQLSGGQRQRVCLARATVVAPDVLLCDEPTSALDVSLAASVINLIGELRSTLGMSVLFVTHDLSVARIVADRIAVMYLGRIVEIGDAEQVIGNPAHPYTKALIDSIPEAGRRPVIPRGEPASPLAPPPGCEFHPRCPIAVDACSDHSLDVRLEGSPGHTHRVACIERKAG